ncbi:GGDEF domain-containing protein [Abyssisolibacter fermentans]|uniref:GGDEF domain-containing protein n=1 Tax=Abyssisolibacter fermentans TaxID=1766203 RepID=UPI000836C090|nr:GGDEF domain-containing protein [Abyssisolibacter fermentans]
MKIYRMKMNSKYKKFFHTVMPYNKQVFMQKKFMHNNLYILFFSVYLTIEQMYYGLYVREIGSLIQKIHFFSAIIMLIFAIISIYIQIKKPINISWIHKTYEIGFGLYGFFIAIIRSLLIKDSIFTLPTVYIAVLYGFAVIFYFHPFKSFFIYGITSIFLIRVLPIYQPTIIQNSYIQDILSNNMIAWIASVINYHKYVRTFLHQKIISKNNEELKQKALQIEKINKTLKYISIRDELTNIYNRRKLDEILEYEYNRAKKYSDVFSVILLDIDLFKYVNDTYGHNVGDKVLIEIAEILKSNTRKNDMVGRWGGEEFLVVCSQTNMNEVLCVSEKLRKAIEAHDFSIVNKTTCSFGVATYKNSETIENLINRADKGLYQAKERGRNRVGFII